MPGDGVVYYHAGGCDTKQINHAPGVPTEGKARTQGAQIRAAPMNVCAPNQSKQLLLMHEEDSSVKSTIRVSGNYTV